MDLIFFVWMCESLPYDRQTSWLNKENKENTWTAYRFQLIIEILTNYKHFY